jgi:hypothetical protein
MSADGDGRKLKVILGSQKPIRSTTVTLKMLTTPETEPIGIASKLRLLYPQHLLQLVVKRRTG